MLTTVNSRCFHGKLNSSDLFLPVRISIYLVAIVNSGFPFCEHSWKKWVEGERSRFVDLSGQLTDQSYVFEVVMGLISCFLFTAYIREIWTESQYQRSYRVNGTIFIFDYFFLFSPLIEFKSDASVRESDGWSVIMLGSPVWIWSENEGSVSQSLVFCRVMSTLLLLGGSETLFYKMRGNGFYFQLLRTANVDK